MKRKPLPRVETLTVEGDVNDDYRITMNGRVFTLYLDSGFWQLSEAGNPKFLELLRKQSRVGAVCAALVLIERHLGINETGRTRCGGENKGASPER